MRLRNNVLLAASITTAFATGVAKVASAGPSDNAREWKAPVSAAERKNPLPPGPRSTAAGKAIYERECASCHGSGGKGDGKDGMDLRTRPTDLSSPIVAGQSDGALFWKVTTGRRPMPGFRKDLTDEERWQVVNFIRTLESRRQ